MNGLHTPGEWRYFFILWEMIIEFQVYDKCARFFPCHVMSRLRASHRDTDTCDYTPFDSQQCIRLVRSMYVGTRAAGGPNSASASIISTAGGEFRYFSDGVRKDMDDDTGSEGTEAHRTCGNGFGEFV